MGHGRDRGRCVVQINGASVYLSLFESEVVYVWSEILDALSRNDVCQLEFSANSSRACSETSSSNAPSRDKSAQSCPGFDQKAVKASSSHESIIIEFIRSEFYVTT